MQVRRATGAQDPEEGACSQSRVRAERRSPVKTLWAGLRGRNTGKGTRPRGGKRRPKGGGSSLPAPPAGPGERSYHHIADLVTHVSLAQTARHLGNRGGRPRVLGEDQKPPEASSARPVQC